MTRPFRPALVLAATVVVLLSGCTAQGTLPAVGTTAAPSADARFACPTTAEVAALAAIPLTSATTSATTCTYTSTTDTGSDASVTVRHSGSASGSTLAALRYAAVSRGEATADVRALSFDAFTAATSDACTAWFVADDAVTSVAARRSGSSGSEACSVASATASLLDRGEPLASAGTVSVIAPERLLGATTAVVGWPWRIAGTSSLRIDRRVGTGYLAPDAEDSFASVGAAVPANSAAVVIVSGTEEAGASRLDVLHAVTAALSAIEVRAKDAEVIVVGPVADGTTPYADLAALRTDLRTAAGIADVRYLDPTAAQYATPGRASLDALADGIARQLADTGIDTRG